MVETYLAIRDRSTTLADRPFSRGDVEFDSIRVYARALKKSDEIINSRLHDGQKSRVNYAVLLRFEYDEDDGVDERWLGLVDRWIRFEAVTKAPNPSDPSGLVESRHVVRIAVLKLWKSVNDMYDGDLSVVDISKHWVHDGIECPIPQSMVNKCLYPILLDRLDYQVCLALLREQDKMYILKPHVASRRM